MAPASGPHGCHRGIYARTGCTAGAASYVPCRRCTNPPATNTSAPPGWPAPGRYAGPYSAGSTRKNPPTAAWCPSRAWLDRRNADRLCSPSPSYGPAGIRRCPSAHRILHPAGAAGARSPAAAHSRTSHNIQAGWARPNSAGGRRPSRAA